MLYVCNQRCKYVRQSNWDCTWQQSLIQTQHRGDRSATKRAATSFRFHPCRTRRTETLMAARDQYAWRASRSSTMQTSQRSGGCTAAEGAPLPLPLAVGTSSASSLSSESDHVARNTRPQTIAVTHGPRHAKTGFAYTHRCQSVASRLWSVHRSSDLLTSWRDVSAFHGIQL